MLSESVILGKYVRNFQKLRQGGTRYGKAPHKPVFLLTLIELIEKGIIVANRISVTPELVATFKENFALLVKAALQDDFTQPFFYLQSEKFWFLRPKAGATIDSHLKSVQTLSDRLDYAYLADDLFSLLTQPAPRLQLRQVLLNTYFEDTQQEFLRMKKDSPSYLQALETQVLNEPAPAYSILQPSDDEETRFVRGGLFKRLVPRVYDFTCAISGLKVITSDGSSLVEACHIVPISISGDDKVTNGMALCPNLHTAFDRGMIGIDEQLRVRVSSQLAENRASSYNLGQFHGKPLRLPFGAIHFPCRDNFRWHWRERFRQ